MNHQRPQTGFLGLLALAEPAAAVEVVPTGAADDLVGCVRVVR